MIIKPVYKVLRAIVLVVIMLVVVTPVSLYILLSLDSVQAKVCGFASEQLSELLGTKVSITRVNIMPFNRVSLRGVSVEDDFGQKALEVGQIGAGISLVDLIFKNDIVITYAELIELKANLYRASADSPLNIQQIIDRLKPKEPKKEPTRFDLAVNMVLIRNSEFNYDILDAPPQESGHFDPHHIHVRGLNADINAPRISNDLYIGDIKRLTAYETSGLRLTNVSLEAQVTPHSAQIKKINLRMPGSQVCLSDLDVKYPAFDSLKTCWKSMPLDISLMPGTYISATDIKPLLPQADVITSPVDVELHLTGTANDLTLSNVDVNVRDWDMGVSWKLATLTGLLAHNPSAVVKELNLQVGKQESSILLPEFKKLSFPARQLITNAGNLHFDADVTANREQVKYNGIVSSNAGEINLDVQADLGKVMKIKGSVATEDFAPAKLLPQLSDLGPVSMSADADLAIQGKTITGTASTVIDNISYKELSLSNIAANADLTPQSISATLDILDDHVSLSSELDIDKSDPHNILSSLQASVDHMDLNYFGVKGLMGHQNISTALNVDLQGGNLNDAVGEMYLSDLTFRSDQDIITHLGDISLNISRDDEQRYITLVSDLLSGQINGDFDYTQVPREVRSMLAAAYPSFIKQPATRDSDDKPCNLAWNFTLLNDTILNPLIHLPVAALDTVKISGMIDSRFGTMTCDIKAPYLRQNNKLIENTRLLFTCAGDRARLVTGTEMMTKFGQMHLEVNATGEDDATRLKLGWKVDNPRTYDGCLDMNVQLAKDAENRLAVNAQVIPSQFVINDTVWEVHPADIIATRQQIAVNNFRIDRAGQYLSINGTSTADSTDHITLALQDIDLDYVFETLNVPNVQFGGVATGEIYASSLLSSRPEINTAPAGLSVMNIRYNHCLMGDAVVHSRFLPEKMGVTIDAVVNQRNGLKSLINGVIYIASQELDFTFRADRAPAGFMKPFMAAFASDVSGEVSGTAHLYGTFSNLDMTGDVSGQNLGLKLGFTNTTYTCTDSLKILPGLIAFKDVVLHDKYGNTAMLTGRVTHKYFKDPTFDFTISNAKNMLVYDVARNNDFPWFGRIFGSGSATVHGVPGLVDIKVAMNTTAGVKGAGSDFTFMITDTEEAEDYKFITFVDRDQVKKDSLKAVDTTPVMVKLLRERMKKHNQQSASVYKMEFNIGITPEATINLIMDPVGGDAITTHGSGHLRMNYINDGELTMYGKYDLEKGSYFFTLQDVIKKYFTIRPGSSITFDGDPYAARLDIVAQYDVRANLTDLDESFATDRELNSTTVNVQALLKVAGDMRSPDITFDLDFPLLTDDTKRKVRSIVSTEDMMNRQIIYLLAMSRFFTPDYMTANRGNELVSMASSTLSSQLTSMLGQLSNNWSIAPQFRSDRGDFSDIEVDVALSSHLLNNRLLLNGNFGYRDKSMNNNSFIGDFDIQYLLNRSGSIRLKAYNRYNDQNYYLRSAQTTQGVGVVFKRDFDNIFSFLNPWRKKKKNKDTAPEPVPMDTVIQTDTVTIYLERPDGEPARP